MGVSMNGMGPTVTRDVRHCVSTEHVTVMTVVVLLTTVNMIRMEDASKYENSADECFD